jgi:hypothetical protein
MSDLSPKSGAERTFDQAALTVSAATPLTCHARIPSGRAASAYEALASPNSKIGLSISLNCLPEAADDDRRRGTTKSGRETGAQEAKKRAAPDGAASLSM